VVVESDKVEIIIGGIEDVEVARHAVLGALRAAREPGVTYKGLTVDMVTRNELVPAAIPSQSDRVAELDSSLAKLPSGGNRRYAPYDSSGGASATALAALGAATAFAGVMQATLVANRGQRCIGSVHASAQALTPVSAPEGASLAASQVSGANGSTSAPSYGLDDQDLEAWKRRLKAAR